MSKQVVKVGAEGLPTGHIVEDRALFGPEGVQAIDVIDSAAVNSDNTQKTNVWVLARNIILIIVIIAFVIFVEILNVRKTDERKQANNANKPSS